MAERYTPPVPPPVLDTLPDDPFEAWLMVQVNVGYDRGWLARNRPALRQRWQTDPHSNLPPPEASLPAFFRPSDRYGEL